MSQNVLDAPMTRKQIEAIIPHRGKWLLLDEVLEIGDKRIVAAKTFTEEECEGHFGIVPGHLVCECLAQAGALLVLYLYPEIRKDEIFLLRTFANFFYPLRPGRRLKLEVELYRLKEGMRIAFLKGESYIESPCGYPLAINMPKIPISGWEGVGKIRT